MIDVGITIDFDFFVPEDTIWDMQHAETQLHHKLLWSMRGDLLDKMKTDGEENVFWSSVLPQLNLDTHALCVSDSHAWAMRSAALQHTDLIINFDRHHDCWPIEDAHADAGMVAAHNWLTWWLNQDCDREVLWVYPDNLDLDDYSAPVWEVEPQFRKVNWSDFDASKWLQADDVVTAMHVCRSGCWVPPWLDEDFLEFIREPAFEIINMQPDPDWDPMKPRWDDPDEQRAAMRKMQDEWKTYRKTVEGMNADERCEEVKVAD
jgi:hypothetical protein